MFVSLHFSERTNNDVLVSVFLSMSFFEITLHMYILPYLEIFTTPLMDERAVIKSLNQRRSVSLKVWNHTAALPQFTFFFFFFLSYLSLKKTEGTNLTAESLAQIIQLQQLKLFFLQLECLGANCWLRMFCAGHCLTQICQETLLHKFTDVKTKGHLVLKNSLCVCSTKSSEHFHKAKSKQEWRDFHTPKSIQYKISVHKSFTLEH